MPTYISCVQQGFNTFDHNILLQKNAWIIRGVEFQWYEEYLSNRMQYVTYNNHKSSREKIICGVPPGSMLGSMLFLLYINDLASVSDIFLYCLLMTLICSLLVKIWKYYVASLMRIWAIYKNGYSVINIFKCSQNSKYGFHSQKLINWWYWS